MSTEQEILASGRRLIMGAGFNGFSYADVAANVGIRKASVHHYFPSKTDLALAVVESSRVQLEQYAQELAKADVPARDQLNAYISYWTTCIADGSAPFCVAAMLAIEIHGLPATVQAAVRAHFDSLTTWIATALEKGRSSKQIEFDGTSRAAAEWFVANVYGAMVSARAYGSADAFANVTAQTMARFA